MIRRFALCAALAAAALWSGTAPVRAQSQDIRPLIDRMDRLQRDMDVMQRNLARGGTGGAVQPVSPPPSPQMAPGAGTVPSSGFVEQTDVRLSALEGQMRDLTGRIEEALNNVSQVQQRLEKLVGDVDFRLGQIEKGGAPAPSAADAAAPAAAAPASPGQPVVRPGEARLQLVPGGPATAPQAAPQAAQAGGAPAAATSVALPVGPPETQYEFAYGLYQQAVQDRGDFGRAETALRSFVTANGTHRLAGDAQYWLGETFYARRDWPNASAAFAEQFRRFPQNAKAPDSLLRLGQSLGQLNRKPDACGTLAELDKRYPTASQSIKIAAQRERSRLQCN
ncbi:MAG: tol-pal system protein YbgF [Proteobacteria bacterium]|nr:tol-pal system protein YbgF [Pseudomonadota bacterium]